MPAKSINRAWVDKLTWAKALSELEADRKKNHKERVRKRKEENEKRKARMQRRREENEERKANRLPPLADIKLEPLPDIEPLKEIKPPAQISFLDTIERGVALELVIGKTNGRTWRVITYRKGAALSKKLDGGTYPAMGVGEAREAARKYFKNPEKYKAKTATGSFKEVAQKWLRRHVEANGLRSEPEIKRILEKYVYPKWADENFLKIRRQQVADLLDDIEDQSGQPQADAVLAVLRGIMTWHQSRDEDYALPIVRGMKRDKRKPKERARNRWLDDHEIRALWKEADGPFGAIVKLALLTAQRREKIATMKWDDIRDGIWTIAKEKREKGTADQIKLPQMALDLIEAQPRFANNCYVFAGSARGRRHRSADRSAPLTFNSWSQRKQELDEKLNFDKPWVIHDLRRTARALMTRATIRADVAELALGHSIKGIQAIYDDPVEYQPMIDHAFQCLANEIEKIINPPEGNVIPLRATGS